MTSPKQQNGRRAQSAAAEFANSNILSPHTPKWRSEAVSNSGCIIHSKAINVKFLLENYLCLRYEFTDKEYEHSFRAYFPSKGQILESSSTALCEVPASEVPLSREKVPISRFVSHGFIANSSDQDPLGGKTTPPPKPRYNSLPAAHTSLPEDSLHFAQKPTPDDGNPFDDIACTSFNSVNSAGARMTCPSTTSSFGSVRQQPCAHHRPTDIPHLCREQSKDSGICSYTSPYHLPPIYPYSAPPCNPYSAQSPYPTPTPPCYPGYWNPWGPYMPPMCGYPPPPPPQYCTNCTSPHPGQFNSQHSSQFNSQHSSQFNSTEFSRTFSERPCSETGGRGYEPVGRGPEPGGRGPEPSRHCEGRPTSRHPSTEQNANYNTWNSAWDKAWAQ